MSRGPKFRTAENSAPGRPGLIRRDGVIEAPSDLSPVAREEFDRLCGVLQQKGTLDRVDLGVVAECSRVKALLDRAHAAVEADLDPKSLRMLGSLTTHRRGLLRELGLTLQPCKSVVKTNAVPDEVDPIASKIKISG